MTGAHAQSGAVCPGHKALTLAQVQKYIEEKVSEESTVQRIESCQVTFSLDAPSLDALVSLGVTSRVLDVLNRMTATQLTPAQAQAVRRTATSVRSGARRFADRYAGRP